MAGVLDPDGISEDLLCQLPPLKSVQHQALPTNKRRVVSNSTGTGGAHAPSGPGSPEHAGTLPSEEDLPALQEKRGEQPACKFCFLWWSSFWFCNLKQQLWRLSSNGSSPSSTPAVLVGEHILVWYTDIHHDASYVGKGYRPFKHPSLVYKLLILRNTDRFNYTSS